MGAEGQFSNFIEKKTKGGLIYPRMLLGFAKKPKVFYDQKVVRTT